MYFPQKILVAVRPVDFGTISAVLGNEFNLCVCYTLEQAIQHLEDDVALIVCGVRFDQRGAFDLLNTAKSNPNTSSVPFFMVIGENVKYSSEILKGIKQAAFAKGANGIFELGTLTSELGKNLAYEQIRQRIRTRLETYSNSGGMRSQPHQLRKRTRRNA